MLNGEGPPMKVGRSGHVNVILRLDLPHKQPCTADKGRTSLTHTFLFALNAAVTSAGAEALMLTDEALTQDLATDFYKPFLPKIPFI